MCIKSFDNARLIFKIFGQKNLRTMKIHTNVWDFCKVFQCSLHPFRDIFHKRLLSTFLSGINLSLDSCNKRCTKPVSSRHARHFSCLSDRIKILSIVCRAISSSYMRHAFPQARFHLYSKHIEILFFFLYICKNVSFLCFDSVAQTGKVSTVMYALDLFLHST